MFFLMNLKRRVTLRPADLGREIEAKLKRKLMQEVEGTCDSNGYIIACMSILDKGPGRIDELTGAVSFQVVYQAMIFKPFDGEVVDGTVKSVMDIGFLVEIGPTDCFVAQQQVPEDLRFDNLQVPQFVNEDRSVKIAKGTEVRLKVQSVTYIGKELSVMGTILGDYLGPIGFQT